MIDNDVAVVFAVVAIAIAVADVVVAVVSVVVAVNACSYLTQHSYSTVHLRILTIE